MEENEKYEKALKSLPLESDDGWMYGWMEKFNDGIPQDND